jgi:hypothetical protein
LNLECDTSIVRWLKLCFSNATCTDRYHQEAPSVEALAALPPLKVALTVGVEVPQLDGAVGLTTSASEASSSITLWATLPPEYPTAAPSLELSATHLPREATRAVLLRLQELAAERTAALGLDGTECLMEVAQEMQDAAAEAAAAAAAATATAAAAAAASGKSSVDAGDDEDEGACHAVVGRVHTLTKCTSWTLPPSLFESLPEPSFCFLFHNCLKTHASL